ncbi:HNH endonuclease [Bdellovibrionota bacterium FG-2]
MGHALVLNASYEPLHIVTWQRAIQLLFQGKVEVIEEYDREIRTVRLSIKMPAVLRLLNYIPTAKKKHIVRFSRANIFVRDKHVCQYCGGSPGKNHLTLDHVIPVVQGGRKCWENIVTACKPCNQKKGGKTPAQAGMELRGKPQRPSWLPTSILQVEVTRSPERWRIYFRSDLDPDSSSS